MGLKPALFSVALLGVLSGCASGTAAMNVDQAVNACASDRSASHHVEVYVPKANVVHVLGVRSSRSGRHEGFVVSTDRQRITVEDNISISGFIPLHSGDVVSLLGQYECDDGVIHWTHRDPRGRHIAGYIEVNGQRYQ